MAKTNLLKLKVGESVYITAQYNSSGVVYKLTKCGKVRRKDTYTYQKVAPDKMQKSPRLYKDHKHIMELRNLDKVKVLPEVKEQVRLDHTLPHFVTHDFFKAIKTGKVDMALFSSNNAVSARGNGITGRGLAYEVQQMFIKMKPKINTKRILGKKLMSGTKRRKQAGGNKHWTRRYDIYDSQVYKLIELNIDGHTTTICNFPVKEGFWEHARMRLIRQSCKQTVKIANDNDYKVIILNFPGIGNGKLAGRYNDIKKILCEELDERFTVLQKPVRKEVK